ncbi:MAG: YcaO-related McrA-glycine thioamidation protein [Vulcanimicrobiaceae bacterium]
MTLQLAAHAPKAPGLPDRCVPLERTLQLLPHLRERFGITRVADTTYLDRTGIPTFSAVVPRSPDLISVYNGKGSSRESALCSAVMEAVERQCAAAAPLLVFERTLREVKQHLDLDILGVLPLSPDEPLVCTSATDLLTQTAIAVPLAMVQCPWFGTKLFTSTSTNGLAAGNTLTEAVYHALCELIERHVWSMYHARSHLLPRVFFGEGARDFGFAREVVFPTGFAQADALAAATGRAGLELRVLYLPEHLMPATMAATVLEPGADPPMTHMGFGASLSPGHALVRAMTEAVQSRVVDIQGAREDVVRADAPPGLMADHGRRATSLPYGRWYFDVPCEPVAFAGIPDAASDDLRQDVDMLLQFLREFRASRVAVVDLSPPDVPVHVVRAIVPELETTLIDGRIGPRMADLVNPFKVEKT